VGFYASDPIAQDKARKQWEEQRLVVETLRIAISNLEVTYKDHTGITPSQWKQYRTSQGIPYWYNEESMETTWDDPLSSIEGSMDVAEGETKEVGDENPWEICYTEEGHQYWHNRNTHQTTWDDPTKNNEFSDSNNDSSSSSAVDGNTSSEWVECYTEEGELYYYHPYTGETRWP
jgi:hypothetical protein